jgi:L-lactate dehydrogenase complex protein LldE
LKVGLFYTCLVNIFDPQLIDKAKNILEFFGFEVVVPKSQTCCAQPNYNSGDFYNSQELSKLFINDFYGLDYIVVPSGSCTGMILKNYPELITNFPDEIKEKYKSLKKNIFEFSDFIYKKIGPEQFSQFSLEKELTYHDSCSGLRQLKIKDQPREILKKIKGVKIIEMSEPEECCGFGGSFSLKFGGISSEIVEKKCSDIIKTDVKNVCLGDLGCALNIKGKLDWMKEDIEVSHLIDILHESMFKKENVI